MSQFIWSGEENRPFQLERPCECGCDDCTMGEENGNYAGYLTGSDEQGRGFTVWIKEEKVFLYIKRKLESERALNGKLE